MGKYLGKPIKQGDLKPPVNPNPLIPSSVDEQLDTIRKAAENLHHQLRWTDYQKTVDFINQSEYSDSWKKILDEFMVVVENILKAGL